MIDSPRCKPPPLPRSVTWSACQQLSSSCAARHYFLLCPSVTQVRLMTFFVLGCFIYIYSLKMVSHLLKTFKDAIGGLKTCIQRDRNEVGWKPHRQITLPARSRRPTPASWPRCVSALTQPPRAIQDDHDKKKKWWLTPICILFYYYFSGQKNKMTILHCESAYLVHSDKAFCPVGL